METISGILYDLAAAVLAVLIPAAVALVVAYLKDRVGVERLEKIARELGRKEDLARLAVLYAQQYFGRVEGPEKYRQASAWLSDRLTEIGINWTPSEIRGLVEAALKDLKAEFGKEWASLAREDKE